MLSKISPPVANRLLGHPKIAQGNQLSPTLCKLAAGSVVLLSATARDSAGESTAGNTVEISAPQASDKLNENKHQKALTS